MPHTKRGPFTLNAAPSYDNPAWLTALDDYAYLSSRAVIHAKDPAYGVTADGTTDDTTAWQAALNAVPSTGATVLAPPGTSLVPSGGLTCANPVTIIGAGAAAGSAAGSILKMTATTGTLLALTGQASGLERMVILHPSSGTRSVGLIGVSMTNANFNRIERNLFQGFSTDLLMDTGVYATITNNSFRDFVLRGLDIRYTGQPDAGDPTIIGNTFDRTGGDATTGGTAVYAQTLGGLKFSGNKINGKSGADAFDYGIRFIAQDGEISSLIMIQNNSIESFITAGVAVSRVSTGSFSNSVMIQGNEINGLAHSASTCVLFDGPSIAAVNIEDNNLVLANIGIDIQNTKHVVIDGNVGYDLVTTGIRVRNLCRDVRIGPSNIMDLQSGGKQLVFDDPYYVSDASWEYSIPFRDITDGSLNDLFEIGMAAFSSAIVDIDLTGTNQGSGAFAHRLSRVYTSNAGAADSNAPTTIGTDHSTGSLTKTFTVSGLGGPVKFGVTKAAGTTLDGHCRVRVRGNALTYFKSLRRDN